MKIDFQLKDTEVGWQSRVDRFFLAAVPQWFSWLGWIIILGGLHYLQAKSKSVLLGIILGLTYGALFRYFIAFFFQFEFTGFPWLKSRRAQFIISSILSGALAFAFWRLAYYLARIAGAFKS